MLADTPEEAPKYWQEFLATIKDRLRKPCKHPTFVMYFFGIIVILGGFGILEPMVSCWLLGRHKPEALPLILVSATYTYFVAIAATAAVDLILSYRQRKFLLMFFLLCSLIVFLCAIFAAIYGTLLSKPSAAAFPAVCGYLLALFLWWIGNANNANLLDTPIVPTNAMGADTKVNPAGSLTGFNS